MRKPLTICAILILPVLAYAAAANGFVTTRPDARYGDDSYNFSADTVIASKFTAPSSGTLTITEIGGFYDGTTGSVIHMAIFTDDGTYPESIVTNSDSGEIDTSSSVLTSATYATYGTQPTVTGGQNYWIAAIFGTAPTQFSRFASGGSSAYRAAGISYPTWPTPAEWEGASTGASDYSGYVVYTGGDSETSGGMLLLGVGN